jgi:dolichyl-phosphate-mannose-protein mannosyltransferase
MRGFCALMGAITIPVVYATMRESGYPIAIAVFSASLILFGEFQLVVPSGSDS